MKQLFSMILLGVVTLMGASASEGFELQNRSTLSIEDDQRNPFLPIGWSKPKAEQKAIPVLTTMLSPEDFMLSSIMLGKQPLAIINGKAYSEGDRAPIAVGNQEVVIEVRAIHDGEVVLGYLDKSITVPLKRR